ncbi:GFA family protein [Paraburkholderia sp. SOS3]|jgi:hypothetical protein|uniref:GFA family protein n=1 Tax=Paraburkholderia sp. SOS3 TaxID=1926494 RepID=UPI0009474009|nr:GFA family protein [Paraburkholderia sp. SOS3]APR38698.1 hypothetical protein BTO02_25045 [Paraburkholderia sp. SOS3]
MAQQHYAGGCDCGAVRFTIDLDLDHTISCNCSNCRKRGLIFWFAAPERFRVTAGGSTQEYGFNRRASRHQVCSVCGVETFFYSEMPDGTEMVAVNARCIDNINPARLKPVADGSNRSQPKALQPSDGAQEQLSPI